jgi:hypothetical protein
MLKSVTGLDLRAKNRIIAWKTWSDGTLLDMTNPLNGGRKTVAMMRALRDQAKNHRDDAKVIAADPNFNQLEANVQADIVAIGEEMDTLLVEMDAETDPDKKFATADGTAKLDATAALRVDDATVEKFKNRASGKMRGQVAPKPNPPGQLK